MNWFFERVTNWWKIDRVRIEPSAGRLLGLKIGDQFVFRTELYVVSDREVLKLEDAHRIVLRLNKPGDQTHIDLVQNSNETRTTATFNRRQTSQPIFDDDLMLLTGTKSLR